MVGQIRERIRVLIIDDVAETRENLRKLLSFAGDIEVVGAAASGAEGIALAKQTQPHIVLMDINMPGMDGIAATEALVQQVPTAQVVILSVQGESDYLRRAMLAGARDFLTKPPSGDELMTTIRKVYETGKKLAAVMAPVQQAAAVTAAKGPAVQRQGKVIAVYSPKGGVGCTTIAVNLAIALQRLVGSASKVALMDANFQFGDVGVMLNLSAGGRSIADLVEAGDGMDSDMVASVVAPHGSGIKVLLAPPHPEAAESLLVPSADGGGVAAFRLVLDLMRREFDIIVVDMNSRVDDIALTIFDASALILLVVMPTVPSIKSARLFLELAQKLNYTPEQIALVINGVDRRRGIRVEQIAQALMPVTAQIPFDEQAVVDAANLGAPFLIRDQGRPISQSIAQLAEHVQNTLTQVQEAEEAEQAAKEPMVPGTGRLRLGRLFR